MILLQTFLQGALLLIINTHSTKLGSGEQLSIHGLASKKKYGSAFKYESRLGSKAKQT